MKKVYVAVTNDLATDQRVIKVCNLLSEMDCRVTMIGILKPGSIPFHPAKFKTKRMRLPFRKGPLFYASYNIRLFLYLLLRKAHIIVSNDLDTLLACRIISFLKRIPLVYDSHEYFVGSTEIANRPLVKNIWAFIEGRIFPGLRYIVTVNESIATLYEKQYKKRPLVVRNVPPKYKIDEAITRKHLGLPENKKIVLMQGGGINIDRGAEELICAMKPQFGLENVYLLFIGGGDMWENIKQLANNLGLSHKIGFLPKMHYNQMMQYTALCDLGASVDKPVSMNYTYSLPNKLFDYIAAGIPVLASPVVEVKRIVETYQVGLCLENHDPEHIASRIKFAFADAHRYEQWKNNATIASQSLCWENEAIPLKKLYSDIIGKDFNPLPTHHTPSASICLLR